LLFGIFPTTMIGAGALPLPMTQIFSASIDILHIVQAGSRIASSIRYYRTSS
jgi:hypothetical protein